MTEPHPLIGLWQLNAFRFIRALLFSGGLSLLFAVDTHVRKSLIYFFLEADESSVAKLRETAALKLGWSGFEVTSVIFCSSFVPDIWAISLSN